MVDLEHEKEVMAKELGTINIALALDCVKLLTWILISNSQLGNYMFGKYRLLLHDNIERNNSNAGLIITWDVKQN